MPDPIPPFEAPLGEPSTVSPASKSPLTCQWCRNRPAAQLVVVDWPAIGRHTSLVCDPCGDERVPESRHVEAMVWRYRLAPLQEVQSV